MKPVILAAALVLSSGCALDLSTVETAPERKPPKRKVVSTSAAPEAIGPYSQAVQVGDTIYLSGQLGVDPATGMLVEGVQAQTRQALANCRAILDEAGFDIDDVVQAKVFLADLNDYGAMNAVYAETFRRKPPARAAVQVARIPLDARVEIMLTAVKSD